MHHVPLNRPRADDGHLDHQVVITARLQPRQHAHLRAALDLEHPHRVGLADHVVNPLISLWHIGQRECAPMMLFHQLETFADCRQHAERQAIDFEDAELVEIVLVPLDHRPPCHGGVFDRHELAQRRVRDHHPAHVLRKMPREGDQILHERDELPPHDRFRVDPHVRAALREVRLVVIAFQPLGQPIHEIERQPKRLADITHGGARTVTNRLGRHAGAVAAVFLVDVLQHLLAPLMLEIDVDVGRFVPLAADEPLEQHVETPGIDRRHAETITDRGIRRRPAPLAEDAARARETDQIPDGEKVGLVAQFFNQRQLVLQ